MTTRYPRIKSTPESPILPVTMTASRRQIHLVLLLLLTVGQLVVAGAAQAAAPIASVAPALTGSPQVLQVLTCGTGVWDQPVALAYEWLIDDVAVPGQVVSTYSIRTADVGHRVGCRVTATTLEPARAAALSSTVTPIRAQQTVSSGFQTSSGGAKACGGSLARACVESRGAGSTVRIGGVLAPARTKAKVVVLLERQSGKVWKLSMSRTAVVSSSGTYSVSIPTRFFAAANWRIRTRVPETDVYDPASSPLRFLHVDR
ncbi:MAG: hypothetical protein JWN72_1369 [Thermoleophilia bacterium]|nr:hypothetical protein [Thermoleophilia bacterium]